MIAYLLETIVCSALFMALYRLLVEGKVAPLPSRIFLVGTMILSAVIPALNLPILPAKAQYVQIPVTTATAEAVSAAAENPASVSVWQVVVVAVYILVALVFLALLCRDLIKIARLRRRGTVSRKRGYTLVENDDVTSPFSFWRTVFIGGEMELRERVVVLSHESSHALHLHTLDKLLLSLLRAVYWFNPFYWMALSSLAQLQEWEADRDTLKDGVDLHIYQMTIFKQMFGYYPDLSSALIQGPVKKRFAMMVKGIKFRQPALRLGAALPLAALLVVMFGAAARPLPKQPQNTQPASVKRITTMDIITAVERDSTGNITAVAGQDDEAIPYALVDQKPQFQGGGANAFSQWVNQHLRYPYDAKKNGIQGRVTLQFSVGSDGNVVDVKVLRSADPSLDKEAVRVVSSSPKWSPGRQNDKPVKVRYTFPVIFRLQHDLTKDTINDAVIVVRKNDSDVELTVNGVVVPKDSLKRIDPSKIESVTVQKEQNRISVVLKDEN